MRGRGQLVTIASMQFLLSRPAQATVLSMPSRATRRRAVATALFISLCSSIAQAGSFTDDLGAAWSRVADTNAWQEPGQWRTVVSPYTLHWRYSDEHRSVYALGVERQSPDRWLLGGSLFRNSFGQPSAYAYVGRRTTELLGSPDLFAQWSVGLMYGYRGKFQHKVPLNVNGFSPGALLSVGWQVNRNVSLMAHALGDAGVMFQLGYDWR